MVTVMRQKGNIYVNRDEFMMQMIKCLGSEEFKKATSHLTLSERQAAMNGMAFCANYAAIHTPYKEEQYE